MKYLALFASFLIGCASSSVHTFNKEGVPIMVTTNIYKSESKFKRAVENHKPGMRGQAKYYLNADECIISVLDDSGMKALDLDRTLGHELRHCIYGDFH